MFVVSFLGSGAFAHYHFLYKLDACFTDDTKTPRRLYFTSGESILKYTFPQQIEKSSVSSVKQIIQHFNKVAQNFPYELTF
jgi:hypothetical protein